MPHLKLFFHDACFDGTASAALFSAFYREREAGAVIHPVGMQHQVGDPFAGVAIDGDDNACVDFRYAAHPRMRWWFDHHATAFQPPRLRADFEARAGDTMAFDPDAPSCAGLVARTLAARFAWTVPAALRSLTGWADTIDAAAYASAAEACSLAAPAQRLALWVGANRDPAATARYIDELSRVGLDELATAAWLRPVLDPALDRRARDREAWAARGQVAGQVVVFDLVGTDLPPPGFSAYELFPDCTYTVTLGRTPTAVKVGVGWNPWGPGPRRHHLGALCERHGGGGHAAVGGITLGGDEVEAGRAAVAAIVDALADGP
ncbi:MAG: phosphoesterase [Kofleriaceae bacterium]|nr:phosphoesterase [Kofleriaceae bacterium]MCL4223971.1 phosphoesterase [Myxococcales bacterium]